MPADSQLLQLEPAGTLVKGSREIARDHHKPAHQAMGVTQQCHFDGNDAFSAQGADHHVNQSPLQHLPWEATGVSAHASGTRPSQDMPGIYEHCPDGMKPLGSFRNVPNKKPFAEGRESRPRTPGGIRMSSCHPLLPYLPGVPLQRARQGLLTRGEWSRAGRGGEHTVKAPRTVQAPRPQPRSPVEVIGQSHRQQGHTDP